MTRVSPSVGDELFVPLHKQHQFEKLHQAYFFPASVLILAGAMVGATSECKDASMPTLQQDTLQQVFFSENMYIIELTA